MIYGNSPQLWQSLRELGKAYILDVGEELQVSVEKPIPSVSQSSEGGGRNRSRLVIEQEKISLKSLTEQIEESQWKTCR